jgi:2,4-dienoyl-CoA reductase-like NADH-dependent reductase (Old Yellow Enzyme family)
MADNSALFHPFTLGKLTLKNRIVMAPMTRNQSPGNVPNDAVVEYYRRRAAGGTGLIFTEGTCVNHIAANGYPDVPYFWGEERLAGWRRVAEAVHAEGGAIAPQLWHCGGMRRAGTMPEGDVNGYTPSGMNVPGKVNRHVMTQQDIDDVVRAFAEGARDARACGFDAVEIHGAHGYLLDQFFWEGTNQREDGYGGSLENRGRFVREIIEACRAAVGPDFMISLRWSQWKQQDYERAAGPHARRAGAFPAAAVRGRCGRFSLLTATFLGAGIRRFGSESGGLDPQDHRQADDYRGQRWAGCGLYTRARRGHLQGGGTCVPG